MIDKSLRPDLGIGTKAAWCDKCQTRFYSAEAFDVHRGITLHRNEDAQDANMCWPRSAKSKLYKLNERYGTREDIVLVKRLEAARAARG